MVRSARVVRIKKKLYYEKNRTQIRLKNKEKYYSDPARNEARRKREAKKLWTVEERREAARQRYAANREAIKAAARRRYAAKKQAKLLSQENDELGETLRRNDGEGGDNTLPQLVLESGQSGTSSGMRKCKTIEEKREAGRRRYAANREAIKAAARRRYVTKKQAKFLSQKNDELGEALGSPETEYQSGSLTWPRRNDRERGEETVISESGRTGTCIPEGNKGFNSILQLPSPDGGGVTSHTLEIDPSALQDYFESTSLAEGWSRPESPCLDVECSPRNTPDQSEDNIIASKLPAQRTSTMNDSGKEIVEVEKRGLKLSKYYFSKLNNLPPPTILIRVGTA